MKSIDRALEAIAACLVEACKLEQLLRDLLRPERPRTKRTRRFWNRGLDRRLRAQYSDRSNADLGRELGFTVFAINGRAGLLGLRKSKAYMATLAAASKLPEAGKAFRFKKGDGRGGIRSAAQLRKFLDAGKKSRFKKGGKPMNTWKPIGTETVTKDNYLVRKVTDVGGYNNDDWQFVHHLVWEKHHGRRVPPRHLVIFLDKNKRNFRIRNLKLVSYEENMRRNTIHRYPLELKKAIRALGKLNRTIRKQNEKD